MKNQVCCVVVLRGWEFTSRRFELHTAFIFSVMRHITLKMKAVRTFETSESNSSTTVPKPEALVPQYEEKFANDKVSSPVSHAADFQHAYVRYNQCFLSRLPTFSLSLHKGPNVWLCYLSHPLEEKEERVLKETADR